MKRRSALKVLIGAGTVPFVTLELLGCARTDDGQARVRWDPPKSQAAVSAYRIKLGRVSGGPYPVTYDVPASASTFEVKVHGKGRWYAVMTAVNAAGESPPTAEVSFVTR